MKKSNKYTINPVVDLVNIPFSSFGSFFVVSKYDAMDGKPIYIRDVRRGDNDPGWLFKVELFDDNTPVLDYSLGGSETELILYRGEKAVHVMMPTENTLRIKTKGLSVKLNYVLKKYDNIFKRAKNKWELCSYSKELRIGLALLEGLLTVDAPWENIGNEYIMLTLDKTSDVVLETFKVVAKSEAEASDDYEVVQNKVAMNYKNWNSDDCTSLDDDKKSVRLANYITWMNFAQPEGLLKRYAMYMSKNWMTNIWSWDNCFGAIYLSKNKPDLAYDQYIFFKDHQHSSGMFPDFVNDTFASYSSAKPPIYGWAYTYMKKRNPVFNQSEKLLEVYETIAKYTQFWLNHRSTEDGLPFYTHGNESGWDNGTFYRSGIPVITPDLCALLIHQMDFLSDLCRDLNRVSEGEHWKYKADNLFKKMMDTLWINDRFVARLVDNHIILDEGDSLQALLPLIISNRLPLNVKERLLESLQDPNRFYSEFGLATEAMNSPFYKENGYWRGPIWAPTMLMFIDILSNMNKEALAVDLAKRFKHCIQLGGMAENFDPKTGKGLVDPCFAWTSSVYLVLVEDYLRKKD